jgi:branched-subunit amino acid transport protein
MYSQQELVLIIAGMAIVTYIPRILPFFTGIDVERYGFLKFIPVAIFSSLAIPDVVIETGAIAPEKIVAGVIAVLVAYRTKRMFLTIASGVTVLFFIKYILAY